MARKSKTVKITTEGRDAGKTFLLTEMDVFAAEKWAARVLLAVFKVAGSESVNPSEGFTGLANLSLSDLSRLDWASAEPLLDEMLSCIKICPNPTDPGITRPLLQDVGDIEEVSTLLTLRKEILGLHFDFFAHAEGSN